MSASLDLKNELEKYKKLYWDQINKNKLLRNNHSFRETSNITKNKNHNDGMIYYINKFKKFGRIKCNGEIYYFNLHSCDIDMNILNVNDIVKFRIIHSFDPNFKLQAYIINYNNNNTNHRTLSDLRMSTKTRNTHTDARTISNMNININTHTNTHTNVDINNISLFYRCPYNCNVKRKTDLGLLSHLGVDGNKRNNCSKNPLSEYCNKRNKNDIIISTQKILKYVKEETKRINRIKQNNQTA